MHPRHGTPAHSSNREEIQRRLNARRGSLLRVAAEPASEGVFAGLAEALARELAEIDSALERITAGTYGACESCGGAIGRQRLLAVPETRYCLACALTPR